LDPELISVGAHITFVPLSRLKCTDIRQHDLPGINISLVQVFSSIQSSSEYSKFIVCQQSRIGEHYFISTRPNITEDGFTDRQIICYKSYAVQTADSLQHYQLACDFDEKVEW
jgi:hypothetical protein